MKKLLLTVFALTALTATAQYQVQNSDFEEWEQVSYGSISGVEPVHWNSFLTGSGSLKSIAGKDQLSQSAEVRPGSAGNSSAKIVDRNVMLKIYAQGNLTTGCINMGSMSAADASGNYNYTDTSNGDFNQPFTGRPDAMHVWVKYYSTNASYLAKANTLLHTDGYYQDPEGNTLTATLVGKAETLDIATSDEWQELTIPFSYEDSEARPAYALVSFATNVTPGTGTGSNYMLIDDLEYVYYSELATLRYAGKNYFVAGQTEYDLSDVQYDATRLSLTSNGNAATIETAFDETTCLLTITIKGDNFSDDPENVHIYTVQFATEETPEPPTPPVTFEAYVVESIDQLSNTEVYTIESQRCFLFTVDGDEGFYTSTAKTSVDVPEQDSADEQQQFAILTTASGKHYLFSMGQQKFLTADPTLLSDEPQAVGITENADGDYRFLFDFDGNFVNTQEEGQLDRGVVINTWSTPDAGNRLRLTACAEADLTEVVAALEEWENPAVPFEPYPTNFSADDRSANSSRYLRSFTLKAVNAEYDENYLAEQQFSVATGGSAPMYVDLTATAMECYEGDELTCEVDFSGYWMHSYLYLDLDQDQLFGFDVDEESHSRADGSELVAFSFYSFGDDAEEHGWSDLGELLTGEARSTLTLSPFAAPEEGVYRGRVKIDWNCIDPAGATAENSGGSIQANGGVVVDFTLHVLPARVPTSLAGTPTAETGCPTYDLSGRKVRSASHGVYIRGGKKLVR